MKIIPFLFFTFSFLISEGQKLKNSMEPIEKAKQDLSEDFMSFDKCLLKSRVEDCNNELIKHSDNEYKKYLIGGALYSIDKEKSYKLHKEAFEVNPNELTFILEYAIELHRNQQFSEAIIQYEKYMHENPEDYRINVWLSECYIHKGNLKKSIEHWNNANHAKNHTGIDFAIYTIHGKTNQIKERSDYREKIKTGDLSSVYPLIFLDLNWEMDWWNNKIQENFLEEDLKLAQEKCGKLSKEYLLISAYSEIKRYSGSADKKEQIKDLLVNTNLILNGKPIPSNGKISSDLLRICFTNGILTEKEFYDTRGVELLDLAKKNKDPELLNIYAYLQANVNGKVNEEIDKLGWKELKDERFASSYFIGLADKNRYDNPELNEALTDFPHSPHLYWVKTNCAKIEGKDIKPHLIELIKREFASLDSNPNRYSYSLKSYFYFLEN